MKLITFTGSAEVGWKLAARAPRKRVTLELGNATPVIVEADADLDDRRREARRERVLLRRPELHLGAARLRPAGRLRRAARRRFLPKVEALVVGDPAEEETDVGPLIDEGARERVLAWIEEARAGGAEILTGGDLDGELVRPTVIADAAPGAEGLVRGGLRARLHRRPRYDSLDEAIELANGTRYGLQAGIFTSNITTRARGRARARVRRRHRQRSADLPGRPDALRRRQGLR